MSIDLTQEPLNARVAEGIRIEMARQRVSQRAIAAVLGRSQNWISERLRGQTQLRLVDVEEFAQGLGISADRLLISEDSPIARRRRTS